MSSKELAEFFKNTGPEDFGGKKAVKPIVYAKPEAPKKKSKKGSFGSFFKKKSEPKADEEELPSKEPNLVSALKLPGKKNRLTLSPEASKTSLMESVDGEQVAEMEEVTKKPEKRLSKVRIIEPYDSNIYATNQSPKVSTHEKPEIVTKKKPIRIKSPPPSASIETDELVDSSLFNNEFKRPIVQKKVTSRLAQRKRAFSHSEQRKPESPVLSLTDQKPYIESVSTVKEVVKKDEPKIEEEGQSSVDTESSDEEIEYTEADRIIIDHKFRRKPDRVYHEKSVWDTENPLATPFLEKMQVKRNVEVYEDYYYSESESDRMSPVDEKSADNVLGEDSVEKSVDQAELLIQSDESFRNDEKVTESVLSDQSDSERGSFVQISETVILTSATVVNSKADKSILRQVEEAAAIKIQSTSTLLDYESSSVSDASPECDGDDDDELDSATASDLKDAAEVKLPGASSPSENGSDSDFDLDTEKESESYAKNPPEEIISSEIVSDSSPMSLPRSQPEENEDSLLSEPVPESPFLLAAESLPVKSPSVATSLVLSDEDEPKSEAEFNLPIHDNEPEKINVEQEKSIGNFDLGEDTLNIQPSLLHTTEQEQPDDIIKDAKGNTEKDLNLFSEDRKLDLTETVEERKAVNDDKDFVLPNVKSLHDLKAKKKTGYKNDAYLETITSVSDEDIEEIAPVREKPKKLTKLKLKPKPMKKTLRPTLSSSEKIKTLENQMEELERLSE